MAIFVVLFFFSVHFQNNCLSRHENFVRENKYFWQRPNCKQKYMFDEMRKDMLWKTVSVSVRISAKFNLWGKRLISKKKEMLLLANSTTFCSPHYVFCLNRLLSPITN